MKLYKLTDQNNKTRPNQLNETILDTYQEERHPHVAEYIRQAVQMGNLIQARDAEAVAERDRQLADRPRQMKNLSPVLGGSVLNDAQNQAGTLSHQPRLGADCLMDDVVGLNFAILSLPGAFKATEVQALCAAMPVNTVPIEADTPQAQAWLKEAGAKAAVIRPDRYLLGLANSLEEIELLLAKVKALQPGQTSTVTVKRQLAKSS